MKTLTDQEKKLLYELETLAARMQNVGAVLQMLQEMAPFCNGTDDGSEGAACRRMRAVRVLEGAEHLTAYYHGEAIRIVESYYRG